ncbi:NUDIX hydrolase [Haloarcula litorea]|uniref:NUDIX hydrolase n=1 Tax=Haloarcula litorea TaxID=3032579 RepID=UPI0023E86082|nr:NUDIX domain-containing protein [Halomicroarcula sp. GDY20]
MANRPREPPTHDATTDGEYRLRPGAKALVTTGSTVLLVKERHADGTPFWTLPGGGVHDGETLGEGLRRELDEELHCRARVGRPVTEFWYAHESLDATVSAYTVFDCDLLSPVTPDATEGILDARWVRPSAVPPTTLPQVRHVCRHETAVPAAASAGD